MPKVRLRIIEDTEANRARQDHRHEYRSYAFVVVEFNGGMALAQLEQQLPEGDWQAVGVMA